MTRGNGSVGVYTVSTAVSCVLERLKHGLAAIDKFVRMNCTTIVLYFSIHYSLVLRRLDLNNSYSVPGLSVKYFTAHFYHVT